MYIIILSTEYTKAQDFNYKHYQLIYNNNYKYSCFFTNLHLRFSINIILFTNNENNEKFNFNLFNQQNYSTDNNLITTSLNVQRFIMKAVGLKSNSIFSKRK